ncbi:MAG: acetylxylan esterase [Fibrobacter sp.]|uniref:acetylxylan esterase n=1 Tax=Fibrobacter sp. TaxID=35828 RepID=UPI0025B7E57F|nr:acetylxylan esterase [Fibrobacter sp.]MBR4785695.1 acetylxylan esterase [Fibrobacter sp.]
MKIKPFFSFAAFALAVMFAISCAAPVPEPEPEPETDPETETEPETDPTPPADTVKLVDLKGTVPVTENWVYTDRPAITIRVENPNKVAVKATAMMRITTDFKKELMTVEKEMEVPAEGTLDIPITTDEDLAPGFYKASCFVNKKSARRFFFGINPTEIVSEPDMLPDFNEFWDAAKAQLESIEMAPNLIEVTKKSSDKCKVYLVEFASVPDGPEGDSVIVRGYYLEPQDGKPHPVIMHFMGYDTPGTFVSCPGANGGDYAEFYLSHRGQYINRAPADKRGDGLDMDFTSEYGDWFAFNFGYRDGYYYRGAFMDCVQAVRFMATRPTSDMNNLFAEGASQGGALTYAVAALSDYTFAAIAPCVAFLGDYPDYFAIVDWPGNTAKDSWKKYVAAHPGLTDEDMYKFLSYFDTKNLATRITCPVIASSCLQDGTCPPHTNLAPYNNLKVTDKQIWFYPELQHQIPSEWPGRYMSFFKNHMK